MRAILFCLVLLLPSLAHALEQTYEMATASIISKTAAVTIGPGGTGDVSLIGLHISTALTGTCVLTGFADSDGAAQSYTLPIGSVGFKDFRGARNTAGPLTITCATSGDDNFVMVLWRTVP